MADPIDELADKWEPAIYQAFVDAIAAIVGQVNVTAIVRFLNVGDVAGAMGVVEAAGLSPGAFAQVEATIAQTFNDGGRTIARRIPSVRGPGGQRLVVMFDIRNPRAEQWVRERSSTLVQQIVEDQRETVRQTLERGIRDGRGPRNIALDLVGRIDPETGARGGGTIGLHSMQEGWLARYTDALGSDDPAELNRLLNYKLRDKRFDRSILAAIREERPLPAAIRAKMRQAYANNALKWRGENIARTEALAALNESQDQAYRQAIDRGAVQREEVRRYWRTAADERVRHTHRLIPGMNKDGRGIDEPFDTPSGPVMKPPHEPMCRCTVSYRIDFLTRAVQALRRRMARAG